MKGILVFNACADDFQEQGKLSKAFLAERVSGIAFSDAVVFHTAQADCHELLKFIPVPNAVLICLPKMRPETMLKQLVKLAAERTADLYLFSGNCFGSEMAARMGQRCGGTSLTAIDRLTCENDQVTAAKAVYSGHMEAEFELSHAPYCLSVARSFTSSAEINQPAALKEARTAPVGNESPFPEDYEFAAEQKEENLKNAPFLLVAGRGVRSKEGVAFLEEAAEKLGAVLGVSRPVAMSAWAPMEKLIGASGAFANPEICIAAGVSGAPAFYVGIEKSKWIVSINTDPKAPIHKKADVCIIDDYCIIMQNLIRAYWEDHDNPNENS